MAKEQKKKKKIFSLTHTQLEEKRGEKSALVALEINGIDDVKVNRKKKKKNTREKFLTQKKSLGYTSSAELIDRS